MGIIPGSLWTLRTVPSASFRCFLPWPGMVPSHALICSHRWLLGGPWSSLSKQLCPCSFFTLKLLTSDARTLSSEMAALSLGLLCLQHRLETLHAVSGLWQGSPHLLLPPVLPGCRGLQVSVLSTREVRRVFQCLTCSRQEGKSHVCSSSLPGRRSKSPCAC